VSMAGYNTVSEILRFNKRAILVPRIGPSAEQRMRASIFSQRGLVTAIDPRELSPSCLATAIVDALSKPAPAPAAMPEMHGVSTVTNTLLAWLNGHAPAIQEKRQSMVKGNLAISR